jgi:glycosyltransferase involved in cell wall biosynthesis
MDLASLRVAIVHEWFVDYSGSERVVEQMLALFPQADLYSQVEFLPDNLRWFIRNKEVTTSFIQKLPGARKHYRSYLPLMTLAVEQFDLSGYDLVISSNHAVAKGVITGPDQLHVCMCYSPIRYAWDMTHTYLKESGLTTGIKGWLAKLILHRMRMWDYRTANGVDEFIAISDHVARRIKKVYGRESTVIYPPVDVGTFELNTKKEDFYLTASRMVPYKKIDLIVETFTKLPDKKLVVIGDGPDYDRVRRNAGSNITYLGFQPTNVLKDYMQRARAFIFAAEEDFGIIPLEAQACGTPIIAYAKGGVLETIVNGVTGVFFNSQTNMDLMAALKTFDDLHDYFDPRLIRQQALKFSRQQFQKAFRTFIEDTIDNHFKQQKALGGRLFLKSMEKTAELLR